MGLFGKKEKSPDIEDLKQRFSSLDGNSSPQQSVSVQQSSSQPQPPQKEEHKPQEVNVVEVEGDKQTETTVPVQGPADDMLEKVLLEKQEEQQEGAKPITKSAINQYLNEIKDSYDDARLINMVIQQVKELIEIDNNLNNRINDTEKLIKEEVSEREKLQKTIEKHYLELKELEKNMDKFVALYELVTNKFNPFLDRTEEDLAMDKAADQHLLGAQAGISDISRLAKSSPKPAAVSLDVPVQEGGAASLFQKLKRQKEMDKASTQEAPASEPAPAPQQESSPVDKVQPPVSQTEGGLSPAETVPQDSDDVAQTKVLPDHLHFRLRSGQTINSLSQLLAFFKENTDETMQDYVTHYKNDFAAWIYHTFHNEWLSKKLSEAGSRESMISVLHEYIRSHQ